MFGKGVGKCSFVVCFPLQNLHFAASAANSQQNHAVNAMTKNPFCCNYTAEQIRKMQLQLHFHFPIPVLQTNIHQKKKKKTKVKIKMKSSNCQHYISFRVSCLVTLPNYWEASVLCELEFFIYFFPSSWSTCACFSHFKSKFRCNIFNTERVLALRGQSPCQLAATSGLHKLLI